MKISASECIAEIQLFDKKREVAPHIYESGQEARQADHPRRAMMTHHR